MLNNRRRKVRVVDITNYKNGNIFESNKCGYVAHGDKGMKLHLKYTHGVEKKNIVTKQFCVRCNRVFHEPVNEHMTRHRFFLSFKIFFFKLVLEKFNAAIFPLL